MRLAYRLAGKIGGIPATISGIVQLGSQSIAVESVSLDQATIEGYVDDTVQLVATVLPANATNKSVTWSSDNEAVATVVNGLVTFVAAGTCTITVTTVDGSFTDTCGVTCNGGHTPVMPG